MNYLNEALILLAPVAIWSVLKFVDNDRIARGIKSLVEKLSGVISSWDIPVVSGGNEVKLKTTMRLTALAVCVGALSGITRIPIPIIYKFLRAGAIEVEKNIKHKPRKSRADVKTYNETTGNA